MLGRVGRHGEATVTLVATKGSAEQQLLIKQPATGCGLRQDFTAWTGKVLQSDSRMQPQSELQRCSASVCSAGGLA